MVQALSFALGRAEPAPAGKRAERGWSLDFAGGASVRVALASLLLVSALVPGLARAGLGAGSPSPVIVLAAPGAGAQAERLVERLGGQVLRQLPIVGGFSAIIPAAAERVLARDPAVVSVSADRTLRPMSTTYNAATDMGSMFTLTTLTGAQAMWQAGYTGKGVDVALIDSGVAPVDGLNGKIINGPDLSFESQASNLRYLDTYGHGTHLGGIIAGRSSGAVAGKYVGDKTNFLGMAPDARIVSIKVADAHGATDVSQVIAAIDWVVQHKNDNGMNIRVLNLSYGTNSTQSAGIDPLSYAAEVAWRKGIVVVAAAGNAGYAQMGTLTNPASDPWVIAVGSAETNGTLAMNDDTVSSFSSSSNWGANGSYRLVDLVAPGAHVVSLRDPGSNIDLNYSSTGAVTGSLFRGSGTSQAAAVVSGAAALILQQRPTLKPDEVKRLLTYSAMLINAPAVSEGNGELNLATGLTWPNSMVVGYNQANYIATGTGTGKLEGSRGSDHLVMNGVTLSGEKDIFGHSFSSSSMATAEANGNSWSGGTWNGNSWSGNSWSGNSWSGNAWSGNSWSGNSWSGNSWSGNSWSGSSWSGSSWSGNDWTGSSWSGSSWSCAGWQ